MRDIKWQMEYLYIDAQVVFLTLLHEVNDNNNEVQETDASISSGRKNFPNFSPFLHLFDKNIDISNEFILMSDPKKNEYFTALTNLSKEKINIKIILKFI